MQLRDAWYDAIHVRRSRRQFDGEPLEPAALRHMEEVCREFRPFPGGRAVLVADRPDRILTGAIGSYGKVKGAAAYVAFVGEMDEPAVQETVGYMGEGIILAATAAGIGTCWVGGYFRPDAVAAEVGVVPSERVLAVTPLGYTTQAWSLEERLMVAAARSGQRKPVAAIYDGPVPSGWLKTALEAARLAPSAVNRQPWRFSVNFCGSRDFSASGDSSDITVGPGAGDVVLTTNEAARTSGHVSRRLDCGIAMLHFELGARHAGVAGEWAFLPAPQVARFVPVE